MKAYIIFSGTGPILILTTHSELEDPQLVDKLQHKGIVKFIAYEVPVERVRSVYGVPYEVIAADLVGCGDGTVGLPPHKRPVRRRDDEPAAVRTYRNVRSSVLMSSQYDG